MDSLNSNKLQAYKSSFQAWKSVAFGYALLALVLVASKWREVSTDLSLLSGIDRLIWAQHGSSSNETSNQTNGSSSVWPPASVVGLETLLTATANTTTPPTVGGQQVSATNSTTTEGDNQLVSRHMQMVLGRELNGNDLLRREVETFLGEYCPQSRKRSVSFLAIDLHDSNFRLLPTANTRTRQKNILLAKLQQTTQANLGAPKKRCALAHCSSPLTLSAGSS